MAPRAAEIDEDALDRSRDREGADVFNGAMLLKDFVPRLALSGSA